MVLDYRTGDMICTECGRVGEATDPKQIEIPAQINQDIICEIISRSTHETASRCRLLCRDLEHLTYESYFKRMHSQRTNIIHGVVLQSIKRYKRNSIFVSTEANKDPGSNLSLKFLPYDNPEIEACDPNTGIMLCTQSLPSSCGQSLYIVCKPSTKQWRCIPRPKTRYWAHGIGIYVLKTKPLTFKIVRVSSRKQKKGCIQDYLYHWELFDSDVWSWRIIDFTCLLEEKYRLLTHYSPVSSCGRLHWRTINGDILSFCVETESINVFSQPEKVPRDFDTFVKLVKYKGNLGLIYVRDDRSCIDLWVLEDYRKRCWILKHKIDLGCARDKDTSFSRYAWPTAFVSSDVAALLGPYKLFLYDFERDKVDSVKIREWLIQDMFSFCSDMKEVDFRRDHSGSNKKHTIKSC